MRVNLVEFLTTSIQYTIWASADVAVDHYVNWHTRDGVTTDLLRERTPGINSLIHDAIVLTICTLSSAALATLTKVNDRVLGRVNSVNLNLIEDVHVNS